MSKQKLELTWIGKDEPIKAEPRILLYDKEKSYGDKNTDNMLIHGDNLLALKALEQNYAGKIKCIYIDPPFNTGARINADGTEIGYDDGVEHSEWLKMMYARFQILRKLLTDDGALFVHLDDNEADYCRLILDELFGRKNFVNRITIDARSPSAFSTVNKGVFKASEYILFYAKNKNNFIENSIKIERTPDYAYDKWIENPTEDYNEWRFSTLAEEYNKISKNNLKPQTIIKNYHEFIIKNADKIFRYTSISDSGAGQETVKLKYLSLENPDKVFMQKRVGYDDIYILNGQQISFYSKNIAEIDGKKVATTMLTNIWTDIAWEGIAKEGSVTFKKGKKPEKLIRRCIELATNPNDLVLDSFLGSGTTAAVAHKMGRRYIGIELGDHCYTHCKPRLEKVIDGEQGGISKAVNWQGGGGFKFYELAPSLLKEDRFGNLIIDETQYNADFLAAAVAKLNGYYFCPDQNTFWKQGKASEQSFIFTTTEFVTGEYLSKISDEMKDGERLLICCPAFEKGKDRVFDNISVKKIPQSVLQKCEFGKNNYNLHIIDTNDIEVEDDEDWE